MNGNISESKKLATSREMLVIRDLKAES